MDTYDYDGTDAAILTGANAVPYGQDFCTGKPGVADGWEYYSTDHGRIQVVNGQLRMDSSKSGSYALNEAILHVNLSDRKNVRLKLDHLSSHDENNAGPTEFHDHRNADLIALSVDGQKWFTVTNLISSFTGKTLALDALLAKADPAGVQRSNVLIKFQQYDNYPWLKTSSSDGRAFDNIQVTGDPPPPKTDLALTDLAVGPASVTTKEFESCTFDLTNNGPTALSSEALLVDYYLSDDATFGDADDFAIGNILFTTSIAAGETKPIALSPLALSNMTRLWPTGKPDGNYYVFARAKINDELPVETSTANNYDRTDTTIAVDLPDLPPPEIIDNGNIGFAASSTWTRSTSKGYLGDYQYAARTISSTPSGTATWTFDGLEPGQYIVATTWPAAISRATNAPFSVYNGVVHSSRLLGTARLNQQAAPNDFQDQGVWWKKLNYNGNGGVFTITGDTLRVRLGNNANNYVMADAVRIERVTTALADQSLADAGDGSESLYQLMAMEQATARAKQAGQADNGTDAVDEALLMWV